MTKRFSLWIYSQVTMHCIGAYISIVGSLVLAGTSVGMEAIEFDCVPC